MGIEEVFDRLMRVDIAVWLDSEGKLRIEKGASGDIKDLVRRHKPEIVAVLRALDVMNHSGVRIVRLPLGGSALAKPRGPLPAEVAEAIEVLGMGTLPIVHNWAGMRRLKYGDWVREQVLDFSNPLWTQEDREAWHRQNEEEAAARLKPKRRARRRRVA
jgi:hypothetical protein